MTRHLFRLFALVGLTLVVALAAHAQAPIGVYLCIPTPAGGCTPVGAGNSVSGTASATTASNTSLITAQAPGLKIYFSSFSCSNSGVTASTLTFTSGSGGTVLWSTQLPAGGGSNAQIFPPVATAAATGLFMTTGSASTTMTCSVSGYTGP